MKSPIYHIKLYTRWREIVWPWAPQRVIIYLVMSGERKFKSQPVLHGLSETCAGRQPSKRTYQLDLSGFTSVSADVDAEVVIYGFAGWRYRPHAA
jgi:hypothetical protein